MKRIVLLFCALCSFCSVWALSGNTVKTVTIAKSDVLPTNYGTHTDSYTFTSNDNSGLAGVILQAKNSDVTIGSTYVNTNYGNCLSLTTSDTEVHTITLTAPSGYVITSYNISASSNSHNYQHKLTATDGTTTGWIDSYGYTGSFVDFESSGLFTQQTTFTIQTANGGNTLYINSFVVEMEQASVATSIASGQYYRLHSSVYSNLNMAESANAVSGAEADETAYNQIWQLTSSGSNYVMKNLFSGNYIQGSTGTSVQYQTAASIYAFAASTVTDDEGSVLFTFQNPSATWYGLHCSSSQNYMVVGWDYATAPSYWKLEQVSITEEDLAAVAELNAVLNNANGYSTALATFFDDAACTTLKSAYSSYSDEALQAALATAGLPTALQEMAVRVKNSTWNEAKDEEYNAYEKSFRIHNYDIWSDCALWRDVTEIGPFSRLFHPTGIQAQAGDVIYLYVDAVPSDEDVTLEVECVSGTAQYGSTTTLQQGCNAIYVAKECELFISYILHNTTKSCNDYSDIKIHIEGGSCTGCFDMQRGHTDNDWAWLKENMFTGTYLHVKGHSTLLNLVTERVVAESSPVNVMRVWDFIFQTMQKLAGCSQWATDGRYKMMVNPYDNLAGGNPFWGSYGSSHPGIYATNLFNSEALRKVGTDGGTIWVIEHELAHAHQDPINLAGMTESSNNSLAQCVNFLSTGATDAYGEIFDSTRSSRGHGVAGLANRFNNGYSWIDMGGMRTKTGTYDDTWISNYLYFQLWLYFDYLGHYQPDGEDSNTGFSFISALYDALRSDPLVQGTSPDNPSAASADWLKMAQYAASITQTDLSEFFDVWGFWELQPTVENDNDNTTDKVWFFGDYTNKYIQTAESYVTTVKSTMQSYPNSGNNIFFIEDRCTGSTLSTYNGNDAETFGTTGYYGSYATAITGTYSYSVSGTTVTIAGTGRGAVGFKIYDDENNLVAIANTESFEVSETVAAGLTAQTYTLKAAQGDGKDVVLTTDRLLGYCVVVDNDIVASLEVEYAEGAPTLPTSLERDYCTYTYYSDADCTQSLETIDSSTNFVYVKCTFAPPFTVSTSYADANWYLVKLRGKYLVYDATAQRYPLYSVAHSEAAGQWAFLGNPYTGIQVINKTAGADMTLYADTYPVLSSDNSTAWFIARNADKGFTLREAQNNVRYLNDTSQNSYLGYWNNSAAASDTGSTFTVEEVPDEYLEQVTANVAPYYSTAGQYFSITETGKTALEAAGYSPSMTTCDETTYSNLINVISTHMNYPATGFYRIKNVNESGYYLGYDGSEDSGNTVCLRGMADATSPKTVVYLTNTNNTTFTLQLQGTCLDVLKQGSKRTPSDNAASCAVTIVQPGVVSFQTSNGTYTYMHCSKSQQYAIVGWTSGSSSASSKWTVEDATEVSMNLNSPDGENYYATFCAPFDVTAIEGASAYTVEVDGRTATPTLVSGTLAAGTPVMLKGSSASATLTIGENYAVAPVMTTSLTGTYTNLSVSASSDYFLGTDGTSVGFFKWDGTTLQANRAYITAATVQGSSAKGFLVDFSGEQTAVENVPQSTTDVPVYDLSGRRVIRTTSGLYIVNGKKLWVR
ncbi:MAG: M60 family metallopeptidase [Bacteroidaceae bacterium]|nr:M60 family metallopeptidase [Bacteroidaceae bacterium]